MHQYLVAIIGHYIFLGGVHYLGEQLLFFSHVDDINSNPNPNRDTGEGLSPLFEARYFGFSQIWILADSVVF